MYDLQTKLLPTGHRLRPGGNYRKTSVTVHSTGNPKSTAENERKWLDNPTNKRMAAWHYCVGDGVVVQAIPEAEESWHCGKDVGNKYSISIEIIESGDRAKVLMTAAEFVADKLKEYGWGIDRLKRHRDWTTKPCPRILIDKSYIKNKMDWNWFVETVEVLMTQKLEEAPIKINGKVYQMERIFLNGTNYIKVRDFAKAGFKVSYEKDMAVLETPENKKGQGN